ncbi:MAG TPA: nucleoside recognition domain-containing protein [Anaerovoracaceae bacterium]|nr:nucleoside recognition domain-containing protein [Anaerovoracaceae bacterium]
MLVGAVKIGFKKGLICCWTLIKIIVPVYVLIIVIKHTPIMGFIIDIFSPVMRIFHLPGQAAVPWITSFFLDEYGAIAAIKAVGLSGKDITIIAIMIILAHSLFIEAAIIKKLGLSIIFFTSYRFIAAVIMGIIFGLVGGVV